MHPARKSIIWRWVTAAVVVLTCAVWFIFFFSAGHMPSAVRQNMGPPELNIPGKETIELLDKSVRLMNSHVSLISGSKANFAFLPRVEAAIKEHDPMNVSLVLIGKNIKFAAVNDRIYAEGEIMPGGEEVLSVNYQGVLIRSPVAGQRLLEWHRPREVSLTR